MQRTDLHDDGLLAIHRVAMPSAARARCASSPAVLLGEVLADCLEALFHSDNVAQRETLASALYAVASASGSTTLRLQAHAWRIVSSMSGAQIAVAVPYGFVQGRGIFRLDVEPLCGDGVVAGDEQCDDGNLEGGDGCSADCGTEEPADLWTEPCARAEPLHVAASNVTLVGTPGDDVLHGDAGGDDLHGGPDDDVLRGGSGERRPRRR